MVRPKDAALEERVAGEHRRLAPFFEATRESLRKRNPGEAFASLSTLRAELESHTAQEDRLYYPALWSLCPEHKDSLERFIRAHDGFRRDLDEIGREISVGALDRATARFEAFSESFAVHEVYEEDLLRTIDEASPWDRTPAAP